MSDSVSPTASAVLVHEASYAQRQLWFLEQLDPGQPAYNINVAIPLPPGTDPDVLRRSLAELVGRHESLRTVFAERDGAPMQVVLRSPEVDLSVTDLRGRPADDQAAQARHWRQQEAGRPFDLAAGPLLRARLLRGDAADELIFVVHHLVADAWSCRVLIEDLQEAYAALARGLAPTLEPLQVQYADYTAWQRRRVDGPDGAETLAYWREQLAGLPTLDLPTDRPRPPATGAAGGSCELAIGTDMARALEDLGRRHRATLFMTLLAAYAVLLHRSSGQPEVVIGSPVAGRDAPELERVVGLFVNRLVLRVDAGGNPTFRELLHRVRQVCLDAFAHQGAPFERLVEELAPSRDASRAPLFQVGFNLQPPVRAGHAGIADRPGQYRNGTVRHDLNLDVTPTGSGLDCLLEYRTDLFDQDTAVRMAKQLGRIVAAVSADPDVRIGTLALLDPDERNRLLRPAPRPAAETAPGDCLPDMVAAQAGRTPDRVAVVGPDGELTFAELRREATALARSLAGHGVRVGDVVGVLVEPSTALVVALLGVLTAGAAYVPLDPADPVDRTALLLADAGSGVVVTAGEPSPLPPGVRAVAVPGRTADGSDVDGPELPAVGPADLAYVVYTSGSTGKPKGVAVEHRQLTAYARAIIERVGFGAGETSAMIQPVTFDSCLTMIVPPLVTGGRLRLVGRDAARDPAALAAVFQHDPVDYLKVTPSHLAALRSGGDPDAVLPRRALILGGEAAPADWVAELVERAGCSVYNHYGPTETTVGVLCGRLHRGALGGAMTAPLGEPLAGTAIYLLDEHREPVPAGVRGEIHVGGDTVARGYVGDAELTAARFPPDPFSTDPDARMYPTGDLARRHADGRIEYLGRTDDQVKIRGMRIEPAELEAALAEHPDVGSVAVVLADGPAGPALAAYVVPRAGAHVDPDRLRAHARQLLPAQMVPATVVPLDALPLTAHGKVDRAALVEPDLDAAAAADAAAPAPRTPAERTLAAVWRDVLGVPRVSVVDNFFDLGGDSILSIRVVARARTAGLALTPGQLFRHQTLAELAAAAAPVTGGSYPDAAPGPVPLTPAQAAFLASRPAGDPEVGRFHQGLVAGLSADLDVETLQRALDALVHRHDALRLRLHRDPGGWRQQLSAEAVPVPLSVEHVEPTGTAAGDDAELDRHVARMESTLDPAAGRLLAATVLDGPAGDRTLLLLAHQFAVDAVSWRILLEDLDTAYRQIATGLSAADVDLPSAGVSFAGWARLLAAEAVSPATAAEAPYWLDPARARARSLVERLGAAGTGGAGGTAGSTDVLWVSADPDTSAALLEEVPAAHGTRLPEVLLAALALAVASGRSETAGAAPLLVDLEGHGRVELAEGVDPSRTVGWFTAGYPAVLDVDPVADPHRALAEVKEQLRAVPRDGIGYGLLRHAGTDPDTAARLAALPAADLGVNYLGQLDALLDRGVPGGLLGERPPRLRWRSARRHALDLDAAVDGGQLRLGWASDPSRLDRDTVADLADRTLAGLLDIVRHTRGRSGPAYTPADFPLAELDQSELDAVTNALGMDAG